jgi:hypothetical protein
MDPHLTTQEGLLLIKKAKRASMWRIVAPPSICLNLINLAHVHPTAGHFGIKKTSKKLRCSSWWPAMNSDMMTFLQGYETCHQGTTRRDRNVLTVAPE